HRYNRGIIYIAGTIADPAPFRRVRPERSPMLPISAVFQVADMLGDAIAPVREPLSAEQLIALARRRTGLTEFGEMAFLDPLQKLLRACYEGANLSVVGRAATRWDVVRFLSNLLRLFDDEERVLEILALPVERPIFISGLPRSDTTYRIPSYRRWLDETGHLEAYRFHKRFLQHLQHQIPDGGRWVLKCPDHVFALDAIRAVYPDARLVFVHRDPLAVLLSVARLTETLRRPFTRSMDKAEIGRQDSDRWLAATELMIAAAQEKRFAEPIFHVQYLD